MESEATVQKLVEKETGVLATQIEDLEERHERLKKEFKRKKESEELLQAEIEALKKVCEIVVVVVSCFVEYFKEQNLALHHEPIRVASEMDRLNHKSFSLINHRSIWSQETFLQ